MSTLEIRGLKVSVTTENGDVEILKGVDLTIKSGETHAIMGPNGSGKSTLAYSIAGHPKYTITGGTVTLDGADVLEMSVDERAKAGLFLAMQYPVEVPGVSLSLTSYELQQEPYVVKLQNFASGLAKSRVQWKRSRWIHPLPHVM